MRLFNPMKDPVVAAKVAAAKQGVVVNTGK